MAARLYFESDDDGHEHRPEISKDGYLCEECDTVIALGRRSGLTCFECNSRIAGDENECPKCGWTWE